MPDEVVICCGVDGGSWTLVGRRGASGNWRFRTVKDETNLLDDEDFADFEPHTETPWVVGWEAALTVFDKYPWASFFYPMRVHPEFAERIWAAVQQRCSEQDECAGHNFEAWHRVCHGGDFD
jgi:hypothetical protein